MFGVGVCSSSPAVAARCSHAEAGVGAVASQNVTDPTLGPLALELMRQGLRAKAAMKQIETQGSFMSYRQILAVDSQGQTAVFSGQHTLGVWAHARADNVAAGGNLLANESIPQAILEAFLNASGHIGSRILVALKRGLTAGGEAGPVHSAGLKIVDKLSWPVADLRCDWTEACPIEAVAQLWEIYEPQMEAYVVRALDPRKAPSYGVPGDDS